MVNGFLSFCECFFTNVSPDGRYFISPLRINGSALESIFSVLKHTSGGNLSAISYSPALGRLISRKALIQNKNSEKGYRDVKLNIDGGGGGQPLLKTRFLFCALVLQIRFVNTSSHPLLLNRHLEEDKAAMPVQ